MMVFYYVHVCVKRIYSFFVMYTKTTIKETEPKKQVDFEKKIFFLLL